MAISDIFSTSFLFSVSIIIILIGCIFAYISYRMGEQDHKLTSMVNLVSILAQDLQFVKSKVNTLQHNSDTTNNLQYSSEIMGGQNLSDLISVSDGEIDNDDEDNIDEDNIDEDNDDDDNEDEDDSSVNDDDEDNDDDNVENSQEQIKILNLSLANEDIQNDSLIEDLDYDIDESSSHYISDIKTIHLEDTINFEESDIPNLLETKQTNFKVSSDDLLGLKNVTNSDLGEIKDVHESKSEYKKMSLNKLREVAVNKGVVVDASKLKKNEILKMLGHE